MILSDVGDARYNERIWQSHVADDFATDVVDGLRAAPKSIPSKYIYDAVGSALFEAIVLLPEYDLPRNELSILQKHAASIVGR
ncbi:MAG TPA: L-histidine N(alpha)-methyltransferase, partial [Candidatus Dormibacteraeota bacterium]|nr:L-histidine N(alpha)-methyltransferase [Candidatus Dormibacteraeota bacterium]